MARTGVITGTATAVSGNVARRQQAKHQPAAPPAPPSWEEQQAWGGPARCAASGRPDTSDMISQLKELAALHERGILTDDELAGQKALLLG